MRARDSKCVELSKTRSYGCLLIVYINVDTCLYPAASLASVLLEMSAIFVVRAVSPIPKSSVYPLKYAPFNYV
jgi:hypothetical protein